MQEWHSKRNASRAEDEGQVEGRVPGQVDRQRQRSFAGTFVASTMDANSGLHWSALISVFKSDRLP